MDREGLTELYRPYGPLVFRHCRRLLGSDADAHDATQEVFVQLVLSADRLDFPTPEHGLRWLYRVSTNHCLKRLVRERRVEARAPADLPEPDPMSSAVGVGALERLVSREQLARLLAGVDEGTRQVFVHAYVDGLDQEAIAALLGVSRRTVGKRLGKLKALARRLEGEA